MAVAMSLTACDTDAACEKREEGDAATESLGLDEGNDDGEARGDVDMQRDGELSAVADPHSETSAVRESVGADDELALSSSLELARIDVVGGGRVAKALADVVTLNGEALTLPDTGIE